MQGVLSPSPKRSRPFAAEDGGSVALREQVLLRSVDADAHAAEVAGLRTQVDTLRAQVVDLTRSLSEARAAAALARD